MNKYQKYVKTRTIWLGDVYKCSFYRKRKIVRNELKDLNLKEVKEVLKLPVGFI